MNGKSLSSAQRQAFFAEGLNLAFTNWTALNLAVSNGWGGRNGAVKKQKLMEAVYRNFIDGRRQLTRDKCATELSSNLLHMFNMELDDESDVEISNLLFDLYDSCMREDLSVLSQIRSHGSLNHQNSRECMFDSNGSVVLKSDVQSSTDESDDSALETETQDERLSTSS